MGLADFTANVLQKLTYLTLLDITFPFKVEMFLTLASSFGNTDGEVGDKIDDTVTKEYLNDRDKMFNLTISDQRAPAKFESKKMNPIFIKSGLFKIQNLLVMYFLTILLMYLDRKFKHFDNRGNEYRLETDKQRHKRLRWYAIFKGLKQKLAWKNFIRAAVASYQPIMFSIMLNIRQASLAKPYLTVSTVLAICSLVVLMYFVANLGYN